MKTIKMAMSACMLLAAMASIGNARAADAAFEADSAKLAAMLAEPQKGERLLWMRKSPFVAESGKLAEQRTLAKSLLARIPAELNGADAARREVLRRRSIVWRIVAGSPDAPARLSPTPFCGELQESALTLDRPGEFGEFVEDPLASDGRAVKMFNSHYEWCVMLMMNRIAFEPGVKYRVRARVRCERTGTASGNAFSAGVFDERTWKTAGYAVRRTNDVGPDYAWYDICTFVPNDGEYFWIAPGKLNKNGDKDANALWLDKISFDALIIEAQMKTTIPLETLLEATPIDKDGNVINGMEISKQVRSGGSYKVVNPLTIRANADGSQEADNIRLVLNAKQGSINDYLKESAHQFDGIKLKATLQNTHNIDASLRATSYIKLTNVRIGVDGGVTIIDK